MFKNALVSVSDKTGLIEALKPLATKGLRIVSTGGTAKFLKENGIAVVDISAQTDFPEILDGRVKTLHPKVHMALLAKMDSPDHVQTLASYNVAPIDLVIGNLYPFENALEKGLHGEELIEQIDIGGPSFLRSAAKNFSSVAVFCNPEDYKMLLADRELTLEDRKKLAAKVFSHVSSYDAMIAQTLNPEFGKNWSLGGELVQELRYGENPHQSAAWYRTRGIQHGLHKAQIIQGKPLSYNNILDLEAATSLVREFSKPSAVAVKHNNPCGVASGKSIFEAVEKCLAADPLSVFGGIVALNSPLDKDCAEKLSHLFLECIVAPKIEKEAKEIFSKKKNLRILEWSDLLDENNFPELRTVAGGFVMQTPDKTGEWSTDWKALNQIPNDEIKKDLIFANKISAGLKSNAIALVWNEQSIGLGMGQVNRVEAVAHAIERWKKHHPDVKHPILASDAFFPFPDSIELLAKVGVQWILQPGGSMNDESVFEAAKKNNINLILTGQRHFRH